MKWTCERQECFLSDYPARDLTFIVELALDEDGKFLGLRGPPAISAPTPAFSFR